MTSIADLRTRRLLRCVFLLGAVGCWLVILTAAAWADTCSTKERDPDHCGNTAWVPGVMIATGGATTGYVLTRGGRPPHVPALWPAPLGGPVAPSARPVTEWIEPGGAGSGTAGGGAGGGGAGGGGASAGGTGGGVGGASGGGASGGSAGPPGVAPPPKTEQVVFSGPDAVDVIQKNGGTWVVGPNGEPRLQVPVGGTIKGIAGTTDPNAPPGTTWIDPNDPIGVVVEQPVPSGPTHTHTGKAAIDELKKQGWPPAVNPETGKPLVDPATGDPLVRVPGGMPGNVRGAGFGTKTVNGVPVVDPNQPVVVITQDPGTSAPPGGTAATGTGTSTPGTSTGPPGTGTPGRAAPPGQAPPGQAPPGPSSTSQPPDAKTGSPATSQPGTGPDTSTTGEPKKDGTADAVKATSEHPLAKALTQPGGGTATIPPGSVEKLIPPKYIDKNGDLVIPKDWPVPDALRELIKGPPPNFSVQPDGTIGVYGADVRVGVDPKTGQLTASGKIGMNTPFGDFSKDLTGPLTEALKPVNDALAAKNVKVIGVKVNPVTGITITTGPK